MEFVDQSEIRTMFSRAMSRMYQSEVPQYGALLKIVNDVNQQTLRNDPNLQKSLQETDNLSRISEERHGAIRLGKPEELHTMRRLFAVMDMHPVGYYDLSVAHIPVHSTGFRPIENKALQKNPFRIFTSLFRVDLINDEQTKKLVNDVLMKREIFSKGVIELIELHESQGGLTVDQAKRFVEEALDTFRWHEKATVSIENYERLKSAHPLAADVVSFKGPHINHLTPRTLDIDRVQALMPEHNINPKAVIEGPPKRNVPILLRQTSFKALDETIQFQTAKGTHQPGMHRARFGEIEQRGVALTPLGRECYDELTEVVRKQIEPSLDGSNAEEYNAILQREFSVFPDDLDVLRQRDFVYLEYRPTEKGLQTKPSRKNLDALIAEGYVTYSPIVYEDFLPVSAAGIFTSNLGDEQSVMATTQSNQSGFEEALGRKIIDPFELYAKQQQASLDKTFKILSIGFADI